MNTELELKLETQKENEFDIILKQALSNLKKYEQLSIEAILNMTKSVNELENNKLRMIKYMAEDIDTLLNLLRSTKGNNEETIPMINEIKRLQANLSSYLETSNKDLIEEIKTNIYNINEYNKKLIVSTRTEKHNTETKEEQERKELEKQQQVHELAIEQKRLHDIIKTEVEKELEKSNINLRPFDYEKLDKAYKSLYYAIDQEKKKDIITRRGRLINLLKANQESINKKYEELRTLVEIKEIINGEDLQEIKLQRIKELLKADKRTVFENYFYNTLNSYEDFKKSFEDLYEFLEVHKTVLYKDALKEELKLHGEALKEDYNKELIDRRRSTGIFIDTLPHTMRISIDKYKNTINQLKLARTGREKSIKREEAAKDLGRIIATPFSCTLKFLTSNWYTLSLLNDGYKVAKAESERMQRIETERSDAINAYQQSHPGVSVEDAARVVDQNANVETYNAQRNAYETQAKLQRMGRVSPRQAEAIQAQEHENVVARANAIEAYQQLNPGISIEEAAIFVDTHANSSSYRAQENAYNTELMLKGMGKKTPRELEREQLEEARQVETSSTNKIFNRKTPRELEGIQKEEFEVEKAKKDAIDNLMKLHPELTEEEAKQIVETSRGTYDAQASAYKKELDLKNNGRMTPREIENIQMNEFIESTQLEETGVYEGNIEEEFNELAKNKFDSRGRRNIVDLDTPDANGNPKHIPSNIDDFPEVTTLYAGTGITAYPDGTLEIEKGAIHGFSLPDGRIMFKNNATKTYVVAVPTGQPGQYRIREIDPVTGEYTQTIVDMNADALTNQDPNQNPLVGLMTNPDQSPNPQSNPNPNLATEPDRVGDNPENKIRYRNPDVSVNLPAAALALFMPGLNPPPALNIAGGYAANVGGMGTASFTAGFQAFGGLGGPTLMHDYMGNTKIY